MAEDKDLEFASLQWLNKVLEDKTETASNCDTENPPATPPSSTLTVPAAGTAASSASLPAPGTHLLFLSKYIIVTKKPNSLDLPSFPESAGVAATAAFLPLKTPGLLGPLGSSQPGPLPRLQIHGHFLGADPCLSRNTCN
ncbi:hypothetical protein MC885_014154 [Smutsia gigantea]|nr:hypothetical protein MC885_014154 [Smutsia gigantea]